MKVTKWTCLKSRNKIEAGGAAVRSDRGRRFPGGVPTVLVCAGMTLVLCAGGCAGKRAEPVLETCYEEDSAADGPEAAEVEGSRDENSGRESLRTGSGADGREKSGAAQEETGQDIPDKSGFAQTGTGPDEGPGGESGQGEITLITVHVCGAVRREGVYRLAAGSRICDAVDAAGGFTEEADTAWLNLAAPVEDAVQIRVPTKEEAKTFGVGAGLAGAGGPENGAGADAGGDAGQTGRINLNTAGKEELMRIPGIGEIRAQRILDYREQNGRFESIEDLMKVPGIKEASFEKLKDYITI